MPPRLTSIDLELSLSAQKPQQYQGYLDEITVTHITSWVRDLRLPKPQSWCH